MNPWKLGKRLGSPLGGAGTFAVGATSMALLACALLGFSPVAVSQQADPLIFRDSMEEFVFIEGEARFLSPLANAEISIGGAIRRQQTTADAQGRFSVKVELGPNDRPVEVRARGVGEQAHEEYASWLGTRDFLLARAGTDRVVGVQELPALRLNPFQTGLYVAMRDLPTSPLSPSGREFERRARSFSSSDFYNRAILLAMLGAKDLSLPQGASTGLQAVSDPTLALAAQLELEQDTRGCPDNPACTASQRVGSDADQLPLIDPPLGTSIQPYLSYAIGMSASGARLRLEADGSGSFSDGFNFASVPIQWQKRDGVVDLRRLDDTPFFQMETFPFHPSCGCQVREQRVYLAYRLRFAEGPAGTLLSGEGWEYERRYPDNPEITTVQVSGDPSVRLSAVVGDIGLQGYTDPSGTTLVLPTCQTAACDEVGIEGNGFHPPSRFTNAPHRFDAAGTGTTTRINRAFTWSLDAEGRLRVIYGDGGQAFWVAASADRQYGAVTGVYTTPQGAEFPLTDIYAPVLLPTGASTGLVAGRTFQGRIGEDYPFSILDAYSGDRPGASPFQFTFNPDGTGIDPNGSSFILSWTLSDEGLFSFTRSRSVPRTNDTFYPQRRTWEVIAEDGASILALESVELPPNPLPAEPVIHPTGRFLRYVRR